MDFRFWRIWNNIILSGFPHPREPYRICNIGKPNIRHIEDQLILQGYTPNYFAWGHLGQVTSMRKIFDIVDGEWRQWHLRVYRNGDLYGHEETAYDSHALKHLNGGYSMIPQHEIEKILSVLDFKERGI